MSRASPRLSTQDTWTDRWHRKRIRLVRPEILVPVETDEHPIHLGEALGIVGAAMFGAVVLWAIAVGFICWVIPI